MPLVYSCISLLHGVTLAEYAAFAGNFGAVAKEYLARTTGEGKLSYAVDGHTFTVLCRGGFGEIHSLFACKGWGHHRASEGRSGRRGRRDWTGRVNT